jgi:polyisoprenyl-phosphate glycosyltransferase
MTRVIGCWPSQTEEPERDRVALSVVAPCYNEAEVLPEFYRRMSAACAQAADSYEILFVNDGSSDATWGILLSFAANDPHVVCLNLSRNYGHQLALTAGLSCCRGDRILIIDADLQDPPELISEMIRLADAGADVVYGQRRSRSGESLFKKATAFLFYRILTAFTDEQIPKDTGDFRLITRRVLDVFNAMPETHRFIRGMISWAGFRQVPLLYDRSPRHAGKTKYPLRKMFGFALDAITSFSVKPLRLAFYVAFVLCGVALALLVYSVYAYFAAETVRGWTSIVSVLLFFLAGQFLVLGLIGEYVGRLYLEAKRRPLFIIDEIARDRSVRRVSAE